MIGQVARLAAFASLLLSGAGQATAGPREDCNHPTDMDLRIRACATLIDAARPNDKAPRIQGYEQRGYAYLVKKDYERSIADATQALTLNPRSAFALAVRADARRRSGNIEQALIDYGRAIKLNPRLSLYYNNRGLTYREGGSFDKAIADYTQAIKLNRNYALAYRNRGDAQRDRDRYREALSDYEAALRINPNTPLAREGRDAAQAVLSSNNSFEDCIQTRDYEKRIVGCSALLSGARENDPNRYFPLHYRSFAYIERGLFDRAVSDASAAIKLRPNVAFTYGNRGDAHRKNEKYDLAIADYTKAISLDAKYFDAYNNRGLSYRKKDELDKSIADFSKALELNPNLAEALVNRGAVYEEKKDYAKALADYEAALKVNSELASAVAGANRAKALAEAQSKPQPQTPPQTPPQQQAQRPQQTPQRPAQTPRTPPPAPPSSAAIVPETGRIALVIGVDAYKNVRPLQAAVADAGSIAEMLRELQFDVTLDKDLDYRAMSSRLASIEQKIRPGDTVFFFFSGHGVALGGVNYLLPADVPSAKAGQESEIQDQSFAVDAIVRRFQRKGARTAIMVLDACRNDPFEQSDDERSASVDTRGLARIEPPEGVFMIFAASARQVSYDRLSQNDSSPNSVFTRIFLQEARTPQARIRDVAKTTQTKVYELAKSVNKVQRPAIYDEVIGEVILKP